MHLRCNALKFSKCSKLRKMHENARKCFKMLRNATKLTKMLIAKKHKNATNARKCENLYTKNASLFPLGLRAAAFRDGHAAVTLGHIRPHYSAPRIPHCCWTRVSIALMIPSPPGPGTEWGPEPAERRRGSGSRDSRPTWRQRWHGAARGDGHGDGHGDGAARTAALW